MLESDNHLQLVESRSESQTIMPPPPPRPRESPPKSEEMPPPDQGCARAVSDTDSAAFPVRRFRSASVGGLPLAVLAESCETIFEEKEVQEEMELNTSL
jgi:hypothetical protein